MERRRKKTKSPHPEEGLENSAFYLTKNSTVKNTGKCMRSWNTNTAKSYGALQIDGKYILSQGQYVMSQGQEHFFNGVVASKKKGKKKQTGFDTLHSYLVNYNRCGKVLR